MTDSGEVKASISHNKSTRGQLEHVAKSLGRARAGSAHTVKTVKRGQLHHIELWVPNLERAIESLGWLLEQLGYVVFQNWEKGSSWKFEGTYIVIEQSRSLTSESYDRLRPGLNHLAFHAGSVKITDDLVQSSLLHGWVLLFAEAHPYAGGPEHYAAYLVNDDGFEVELVADLPNT